MTNGNQQTTGPGEQPPGMGPAGGVPPGANPADATGAGGGNIGAGSVPQPGEDQFAAQAAVPQGSNQNQQGQ